MTALKDIRLDYDYVSLAFAYVLTTIREGRNLSEDELARSLDIDPVHCRAVESGEYGPSLHFILKLAAWIDCPPEELIASTCERLAALSREARASEEAWAARLSPTARGEPPTTPPAS